MNRALALTCGITAAVSFSTAPLSAQTSTNVVDSKSDWSVFVENEPLRCWIVSKPTKTVNKRGGKVVTVNRSDIRFFVTYLPKSGVRGEVSFTGGYPFKPDTPVRLTVGSATYNMYPDGEYAWPESSAVDSKIRASLQRGSSAVVNAQSARGTQTSDTFSLIGFTAALAEAEKRCK
jgi:invasion associated locus B (IalB) protein